MYKHRQIAHVINTLIVTISILAIPLIAIRGNILLIPLILGMMIIALLLFYSLTVRVDDRTLTFYFGVGLIRRSIPISIILSCIEITTPWYHGFGIHYTGNGWLFNVSGFSAVEITLENGKRFRLGTDEPKELYRVINAAILKR
jgi:hypothetical protein